MTVERRIAPGREEDFERWSDELTAAGSTFPGFLGAGMLRPVRLGDPWHVIFRFDSAEHLRAWEQSPKRLELLEQGEELIHSTRMHKVSGLETWFALPGRTAPPPPKWKMFLVTLAGIYVLNLLLSLAYGWAIAGWPLPLRILLTAVPIIALMTWVVMPRATRLLRNWLYPPPDRARADPSERS